VFDGNAALVDLAAAAPVTPAPPAPVPVPSVPSAPAPQPEGDGGDADDDPIYTLEFDRTFAPFGILPQAGDGPDDSELTVDELPPAPEPEPPAAELPVDEELVAAPLPDDGHEEPLEPVEPVEPVTAAPSAKAPPLLLRESRPATVTLPLAPSAPPVAPRTPRTKAAQARAARRSKLTPTRIEPPKLRVPESDEPEFVRRGRQRERSGKAVRIAMAAGSLLLLLVLAAQLAYSFRNTLAARYPDMKPSLVAVCKLLGCRVELPAQIDQLVIDTGELTTLGGNAYAFSTQLRNQGDSAQAWPSLELTLLDPDEKPLVRRVFGPRDYLPAGPLQAAGFGARAEQPVKLHFRVEDPAPSGYHIAVFYP
ncbi:MAG: DUF3426 domain-containing protein, partial [Telluria sp.]